MWDWLLHGDERHENNTITSIEFEEWKSRSDCTEKRSKYLDLIAKEFDEYKLGWITIRFNW